MRRDPHEFVRHIFDGKRYSRKRFEAFRYALLPVIYQTCGCSMREAEQAYDQYAKENADEEAR